MYSTYLIACTLSLHVYGKLSRIQDELKWYHFLRLTITGRDQGRSSSLRVLHSDHLILHHCFELLNNEL